VPLRLCVKKRGSEVLYFRRSDVPLARRAPVPIFEGMRLVWRVLAAALIPIAAVQSQDSLTTVPAYRARILGVFDANVNISCPRIGARRGECFAVAGRLDSKYMVLGGACELDLYVNGAIYTDNDLEKLAVAEFAAVEFYAGGATIPVQHNKTGSNCGVLLLWTRER